MSEKRETLMIIDGSSLVHRAFYALPPLTTKDGLHTNSVYGFMTMLYKLKEEYDIDYLMVAFDMKGPTFRTEMYKEYKGHRKSTPPELREQFPLVKEILASMKIPVLEMMEYEADDIAGTLAKKGESEGKNVILVTGDRDYLQLASEFTRVLITKKGITEMVEYYDKDIVEEYGITPEQLIELKGLMGDSSDNIPGVPGIGEKTGLNLIREFGSIDGVYENIDKVTGKKRVENLVENEDLARLSRDLGRIKLDIPLDIEIDDMKIEEPDYEKLLELYTMMDFRSLLNKLPDGIGGKELEEFVVEYRLARESEYDRIISEIVDKKAMNFKFLFDGENYINSKMLGVGIKTSVENYYIDFLEDNSRDIFADKFKNIFQDSSIEKHCHMIKEDTFGLLSMGIDIDGVKFDTKLGQYMVDPSQNNYDIDELGRSYLGIDLKSLEDRLGKGKKKILFSQLKVEDRAEYIVETLEVVARIKDEMEGLISEQGMDDLYYDIELPLSIVLANMEYEGFKVDKKVLEDLGETFKNRIEDLTQTIYDLAGVEFNINSPKQLGEILFDRLELPVIKKTKTGYSTNVEVLEKLQGQHPIIDHIFEYRQVVKLNSTYIEGLLEVIDENTGKVHSTFNQTITTTGRISSTEPNLQNIPIRTQDGRNIRKAFVARDEDYKLVDGDYSQIELRVLAHISKDEKLIDAFNNKIDIHTRTASEVFHMEEAEVTSLMRARAKAVNFGIIYGISDYGLSRDLNISREEAKSYIENYLHNFKDVEKYMKDIVEFGKEKGYVETIFHRRRYIPELKSSNFNVRGFGERIALNTPIQGSAADIIKLSMVKVFSRLKEEKLESKLILQVHDELIIETHRDEEEKVKQIMKEIMENCIELDVPLVVDIETGDSWYETM